MHVKMRKTLAFFRILPMTLIRWCLGRFILLVDMLYRPSGVSRSAQEQRLLDEQLSKLSLYQYTACPFCVKVRWAMRRLSIDIEARNPKINAEYKVDLLTNGGQLKVPCLRIDHGNDHIEWLYESSDIIAYLDRHFLVSELPAINA